MPDKLIYYFDRNARYTGEADVLPVMSNCKILTVTWNSDKYTDPPHPMRRQLLPLECSSVSKTIICENKYYINIMGYGCCSYCGSLCFLNYDYLEIILKKFPIVETFAEYDSYIEEIKRSKIIFENIPEAEEIFIVY